MTEATLLERQPSGPAPLAERLIVRALNPADLDDVYALVNLPGYRRNTLRVPFQTIEETRKFLESRPPGHVGIAAVLDGRVVGTAGFERLPGRRGHTAYLGMGVRDDCVGQGVGTALLRALIDTADNWLNLRRLELTVFVDNAPAIALYERHGFVIEGTLRDYAFRDGAFVDAYTMARIRG
ncbi:MAG TPA: GNAT family N-acetyltransferase [Microvirga sp.]|jgi:putative acetyltransferase